MPRARKTLTKLLGRILLLAFLLQGIGTGQHMNLEHLGTAAEGASWQSTAPLNPAQVAESWECSFCSAGRRLELGTPPNVLAMGAEARPLAGRVGCAPERMPWPDGLRSCCERAPPLLG